MVERVCDPTTNLVDALAQDILRPGESDQLVSDIFVSLFLLTKMAPCIHVQSRLENDVGWLVLRAKASAIWNVLANIEKNNCRGCGHVGVGNGIGNGHVGVGNGNGHVGGHDYSDSAGIVERDGQSDCDVDGDGDGWPLY